MYMELSEEAPLICAVGEEDAAEPAPVLVAAVVNDPVPDPRGAVGPAVVLLNAGKVEVTDATTWERVMVEVCVVVEVRVVVRPEVDCAAARRGRSNAAEMVEKRIVLLRRLGIWEASWCAMDG